MEYMAINFTDVSAIPEYPVSRSERFIHFLRIIPKMRAFEHKTGLKSRR
jgi:hypothetical protein